MPQRNSSEKRITAFDVDGTLITHEGNPRPSVIRKLHRAVQQTNNRVIVWSRGGKRHAQSVGKALGLKNVEYFSKSSFNKVPDVAYDDEEHTLGVKNIAV